MNDMQRVFDAVAALTAGWDEHIEYSVCVDGRNIEARAKTVRHPALIVQLKEAGAERTSCGSQERGSPNKPGPRPPGNMAPLHLLDTINEEAHFVYADLWRNTKGTDPILEAKDKRLPLLLRSLTILVEQSHEYPDLIHEVARQAKGWVNKAKVMLGYQRPYTMLATSVCGECGGALIVAVDASTDVRCIGTPDCVPCGMVYRQEDWISLLPDLVTTDGAITHILGEEADPRERKLIRFRLYNWAAAGKLTRHGGTGNGAARWDLREIEQIVSAIPVDNPV